MPKEIRKRKVVEEKKEEPLQHFPQPHIQKTPIGSTILQYLVIIMAGALIYAFFHFSIHISPLSGTAVLFFSLACAFTWVEILKWGVTKPFTCIKCMAGWIALLFALVFHVDHPYLYLPAGLFVGAVFEAIKMRYL
jgi:hypothetical protein